MTSRSDGKWAGGFDPGSDGGAFVVLSTPTRAILACRWHHHVVKGSRRYMLHSYCALDTAAKVEPGLVGTWSLGEALLTQLLRITALNGVSLYTEDMYIGQNPRTAVELAKFTGAVASRLEPHTGPSAYVKPAMWRKSVLGIQRVFTKRDVVKAESLRQMPMRVENLAQMMDKLGGTSEHVCDAAGVALWGMQGGNDGKQGAKARR